MDLKQTPLNVIVSQVENGYIVYETEFYRLGAALYNRGNPDSERQDLRAQWVCKDIEAVGVLLKKIAADRLPIP